MYRQEEKERLVEIQRGREREAGGEERREWEKGWGGGGGGGGHFYKEIIIGMKFDITKK